MLTIAILGTCVHEFGHAIVAYLGGDTSVKEKGYLTFNPLKYSHPTYSLVIPLIFLMLGGIALPGGAVYIDRSKLRNRWWHSAVSAAGPLATGLVAWLLAIAFRWGQKTDHWLWSAIGFLVVIEIAAFFLNLLPIPGLDGFGIIEPWLSQSMREKLKPLYQYGTLILLGLLWYAPLSRVLLWQPTFAIVDLIGIKREQYVTGYLILQGWAVPLFILLIIVHLVYRKLENRSEEDS